MDNYITLSEAVNGMQQQGYMYNFNIQGNVLQCNEKGIELKPEELLLRWGVMTFLVWVAWRLIQRGQGKPRAIYFAGAIMISSVVFGLGHLPIAFALSPVVTSSLVFYIIAANATFGLIAGYLYWKKGLEAAMVAHMMGHVIVVTVSKLDLI